MIYIKHYKKFDKLEKRIEAVQVNCNQKLNISLANELNARVEALEHRFNETERKDNDSVEKLFNIFKDFRKRIEVLKKDIKDIKYLSGFIKEPEKPKESLHSVLIGCGVESMASLDFLKQEIRQLVIERVKEVAKDNYEPNLDKFIKGIENL